MTIFALDIETDTTFNGLDPSVSKVISLSVVSDKEIILIDTPREVILFTVFQDWLVSLSDEDTIISWNGAVFDFPFLADRARILNVPLAISLLPDPTITPKYEPLPGHQGGYAVIPYAGKHVDIAYKYKDWAEKNNVKWSLKPVAKARGIDVVETDASNVSNLSSFARLQYNLSDSLATLELAGQIGLSA